MSEADSGYKKGDFQHEVLWPVTSMLGMMRPLHFLVLKYVAEIQEGDTVLELGSGLIPNYEIYAEKVGKSGVFVALDSREKVQKGAKKIAFWFGKLLKPDTETSLITAMPKIRCHLPTTLLIRS
ncbi:MAG: hypothetical protein WAU07_02635 [Microgenomates group bacterium]